jgi:hypothetical protein
LELGGRTVEEKELLCRNLLIPEFNRSWTMLSKQQNLLKTAQNCPNLPKSARRGNFEIPPEIEILIFLKNKNSNVEQRH